MRQATHPDGPSRSPGAPNGDAPEAPPEEPRLVDHAASLVEHVRALVAASLELARLEGARARATLRRRLAGAAAAAGLGLLLLVAACVAVAQLVLGVVGAATELCGGRPWAGRLVGAGLVLAAGAGALGWAWRRAERRRVRARTEDETGLDAPQEPG